MQARGSLGNLAQAPGYHKIKVPILYTGRAGKASARGGEYGANQLYSRESIVNSSQKAAGWRRASSALRFMPLAARSRLDSDGRVDVFMSSSGQDAEPKNRGSAPAGRGQTYCYTCFEPTPQRFLVLCLAMGRFARVVVTNVAHHVTQRGNARQFLLASDAERLVYLDLFPIIRQSGLLQDLKTCITLRLSQASLSQASLSPASNLQFEVSALRRRSGSPITP